MIDDNTCYRCPRSKWHEGPCDGFDERGNLLPSEPPVKEIPVPQNEQMTRYSLMRTESGRTTMQPFEHGLYVKYTDHKRAMSALSQPVPRNLIMLIKEAQGAVSDGNQGTALRALEDALRLAYRVGSQPVPQGEQSQQSKLDEQSKEIERLIDCVHGANEGFEEYERKFYLERNAKEDLEARVKELEAQIEAAKVVKWVDVNQELPQNECFVQTFGHTERSPRSVVNEWRQEVARYLNGRFWTNSHIYVTHWAALPDAPVVADSKRGVE